MKKNTYYWVNFLHFYLPPTTDQDKLDEAVKKSYEWILLMAEKYPNWHFSLNLTGCLTKLLVDHGYQDIITRFKKLIASGQLELVDSLSHHPIAPLVDEKIVHQQIKLQQQINQQYFATKASGFFLPEMAYNKKIGQLIADYNYKWLILDEINLTGKLNQVDWQKKYKLKNSNLNLVFRSRDWSLDYPPRKLVKTLELKPLPPYLVTATDAELYGLRFIDWQGWLGKILENQEIQTLSINQYLKQLNEEIVADPQAGNWESLEKELKQKFIFPLWRGQKNKIHQLLWQLAKLASQELFNNPQDNNYYWAENHLNRGLASCTFWWASNKDFKLFGAPAWHPEEVEKGALELVKTIRTLNTKKNIKFKAEKIYHQLKYLLWTTHWKKYGQ